MVRLVGASVRRTGWLTMTLYHLHLLGDDPYRAGGDCRSALTRVVGSLRAAISAIDRSIAALTVRFLRKERACHGGDGGESSPQHDLVRYPQAPLILGDKWDF
jgi:hypothetical protein